MNCYGAHTMFSAQLIRILQKTLLSYWNTATHLTCTCHSTGTRQSQEIATVHPLVDKMDICERTFHFMKCILESIPLWPLSSTWKKWVMSNSALEITKIYSHRDCERREQAGSEWWPSRCGTHTGASRARNTAKNALWSTKPKVGWRWTSARQQVQDQQ